MTETNSITTKHVVYSCTHSFFCSSPTRLLPICLTLTFKIELWLSDIAAWITTSPWVWIVWPSLAVPLTKPLWSLLFKSFSNWKAHNHIFGCCWTLPQHTSWSRGCSQTAQKTWRPFSGGGLKRCCAGHKWRRQRRLWVSMVSWQRGITHWLLGWSQIPMVWCSLHLTGMSWSNNQNNNE